MNLHLKFQRPALAGGRSPGVRPLRPAASAWWGLALLATVAGVWGLFWRPAPEAKQSRLDPAAMMAVSQWFQARLASSAGLPAHGHVLFASDASCPCDDSAREDFEALRRQWASHGFRFERLAHGDAPTALPAGDDLLVFAPDGRLLFAGGLHAQGLCGGGTALGSFVLASIAGGRQPSSSWSAPGQCSCRTFPEGA